MLYSVFRQMVRLPEYIQTRIAQLAPRKLNQPYAAGLVLALTLAVSGCAPSSDQVVEDPTSTATPETVIPKQTTPPPVESPDKTEPVEAQPDGSNADLKQPDASDEMVTVSVYTIDDQCNGFVEQAVEVPRSVAMDEAVGKVVGDTQLNAFKLAGYQVQVDGSTAIVDMRLEPGSERQFVSLSSCEQRSLFGGVEETLLNNPNWNVEAVKFTNAGKELLL